MSSALSLLQSASSPNKPYHGFSKLQIGTYEIYHFRLVPNKLYNSKEKKSLKKVLLIELKEQVLFLPDYFAASIREDEKKVNELNTDGVRKFLCFGGARPNK